MGKSRPIVIECGPKTGTGESALFVVKALGVPEVEPMTAFREVLGTSLARALGVDVPEPALVDVPSDFVRLVAPLGALSDRPLQAGTCFGSRYLGPGLRTPNAETKFDTPELVAAAVRIYGLDLTFQNLDRQVGNPNCALRDGRIFAFDFERMFEFTGWRKGGEKVAACWPNQLPSHANISLHASRLVIASR